MRYRGEIDGLRAIAVVPVVVYHAGFSSLSGGFLGVDIFFVISGYLITTIILSELEAGTFSLREFYARRARRILPAAFAVMLVCIPFAVAWLMPSDLHKFSKSVVAVSLFGSNFLFWNETGYFDTAAKLKPLLHTWSLAIEEQFYVLFPLFLLLTANFHKTRVLIILFIVFTLSLTIAQFTSTAASSKIASSAFYLLPARAWELILGAFVAFWLKENPSTKYTHASQVASLAGLALIIFALCFFDDTTPLPGLYSLVPTIGAALIILFACQGTVAHYILQNRALVGIGLVSYSAYLWHQPLLAFARYVTISDFDIYAMLGICIATFVLAYLTWRWIEQPFRRSRSVTSAQVLWTSLGAIAVFVTIGIIGQEKSIRAWRLPAHLTGDIRYAGEKVSWLAISKKQSPEFVLYGDSHAKQYFKALRDKFGSGSIIAEPACMALPGIVNLYKGRSVTRTNCTEKFDHLVEYVKSKRPKRLFIVYSWNKDLVNLSSGTPIGKGGSPDGLKAIAHGLSTLVSRVPKDLKIYLIGNVPRADVANPWMAKGYIRCHFYIGSKCVDQYPRHLGSVQPLNSFLKKLATGYPGRKITFVDPYDSLCDVRSCFIRIDQRLVYSDHSHLTSFGSKKVVDDIR